MTETCPRCRTPIRFGASFCTKCGSRRQADTSPPPTPTGPHQAATTGIRQSGRGQRRPVPLALGTLALLLFVSVFWQFCIGFERGLRGVNPNSSLPRQTQTAPALQPAMAPATPVETDHAQPAAVTPFDQAANETYILPPIKKGDFISIATRL